MNLQAPDQMTDPALIDEVGAMSRRLLTRWTMPVVASLTAALAVGCGGDNETLPPPELIQITAANQVAVARATAVDSSDLVGIMGLWRSTAPLAQQLDASAASTARALREAIAGARESATGARPAGMLSWTTPCSASGSKAVTLDDRDGDTLPSSGDVLTVVFNDCQERTSPLIQGSLIVNVTGFSDAQFSGLFTFAQLKVIAGRSTHSWSGQAHCVYGAEVDASGTETFRMKLTVAAERLVMSIFQPSYSETFTHDPDFSATWADVSPMTTPEFWTTTTSGTLSVASLGGKLIVVTDPALHGLFGEGWPDSGQMLITGFQSRLRMTMLDSATVRLELDANNDGTFESSRDIPWVALWPS